MDILDKQLDRGQTSHGYIFESKDLDLARDKAYVFAARVLDSQPGSKVFDRDLVELEADGRTISIDSVREMIGFFQSRPFYGSYKIAIIGDGAKLTQEASNAMLRTLEELASYGKIIILVRNAFELLPTIRSRCQLVSFAGKTDYNLDKDFVEGLVDSFLNKDLTVIVKNKDQLEKMKDQGKEFFALAIDYMGKLRQEAGGYDKDLLDSGIARAIDISSNLDMNVNFMLSVETFALGFI